MNSHAASPAPRFPAAPARAVRSLVGLGAAAVLLLAGCGTAATDTGQTAGGEAAAAPDGCVTDFQPGTDYYPDKLEVTHAANLDISYHDAYQVVEISQGDPESGAQSYVLHRCGTPVPDLAGDLAGAQVIETPVESVFTASTTHLGLIDVLERADVVTGVATTAYVSSPAVRERIAADEVVEFAPVGAVNTELVIASDPGLLLTQGMETGANAPVRAAGIPVMADAEWLETTPLGRAEWVKLFGALTGEESEATEAFTEIEQAYRDTAALAEDSEPVSVLPNQMFEGTWNIPTGDSYAAVLMADAHMSYPWADTTGAGTQEISLEDALAKGRDAQVWLMNTNVDTLAEVRAADARYVEFDAFERGEVWTNNLAMTPEGGNDYWERGVARPDLVLADLVAIAHPDRLPDHEFTFYRKLDA